MGKDSTQIAVDASNKSDKSSATNFGPNCLLSHLSSVYFIILIALQCKNDDEGRFNTYIKKELLAATTDVNSGRSRDYCVVF